MENQETLKEKVAEVIENFFTEYMSLKPKSISLVIQSDFILAILHDALSMADKVYAEGEISGNLLNTYYKSIFVASKHLLEEAINQVYPQRVARLFFSLDLGSGKHIVGISLNKNSSYHYANYRKDGDAQ